MSEARALTSCISNAVAVVVVSMWEMRVTGRFSNANSIRTTQTRKTRWKKPKSKARLHLEKDRWSTTRLAHLMEGR